MVVAEKWSYSVAEIFCVIKQFYMLYTRIYHTEWALMWIRFPDWWCARDMVSNAFNGTIPESLQGPSWGHYSRIAFTAFRCIVYGIWMGSNVISPNYNSYRVDISCSWKLCSVIFVMYHISIKSLVLYVYVKSWCALLMYEVWSLILLRAKWLFYSA